MAAMGKRKSFIIADGINALEKGRPTGLPEFSEFFPRIGAGAGPFALYT